MPTITKQFSLKSGDSINLSIESNSVLSNLDKFTSLSSVRNIVSRSTIYPRFRISVLNPDETIKYVIPNEDILAGGSYNENYQNGSRRTLSFSLINNSGKYTPSINGLWVGTRVLFEVGLEVPDESVTLWFKKGVFVMNAPKPSKTVDSMTVSIDCQDKFSLFEGKQGVINTTTEIEVGTKVKDIIEDTLNIDMGNGVLFDYKQPRLDPSYTNFVTPLTISLSAGSNYGELFTQLAEILSAEIFYDSDGYLVIAPATEVTADGDKPVLYDYDESLTQGESFDFDMESFINCVYVVGANINGHTCIATTRNDDPSSPLCVSRIGLRTSIINDSNITNDILAQERADYELRKVLILKSTLSSPVFFNPMLSVNNMVTFTDEDFLLQKNKFLIQSLSFSVGYEGTMSINVSNISNLPFVAIGYDSSGIGIEELGVPQNVTLIIYNDTKYTANNDPVGYNNQLILKWNRVTHASSYLIYAGDSLIDSVPDPGTVLPEELTYNLWNNGSVNTGGIKSISIRAHSDDYYDSANSASVNFQMMIEKPYNLTVTNNSSAINWIGNNKTENYNIVVYKTQGQSVQEVATFGSQSSVYSKAIGDENDYINDTKMPAGEYSARVTAIGTSGGYRDSRNSDEIDFTKLEKPANVIFNANNELSFTNQSQNANKFNIYVTTSGGTKTLLGESSAAITTYTINSPVLQDCTADPNNPTTITDDGTSVTLKFWTTDDYVFETSISSVDVANANKVSWVVNDYEYSQNGDTVSLNNAPYSQSGDIVTIS